eukprot:COSAG06_NODE_8_length_37897_cov_42.611884_9_plen_56_part_00
MKGPFHREPRGFREWATLHHASSVAQKLRETEDRFPEAHVGAWGGAPSTLGAPGR